MIAKGKDIAWKENAMITDAIIAKGIVVIVVLEARKFVIGPEAEVENVKNESADDQSKFTFVS